MYNLDIILRGYLQESIEAVKHFLKKIQNFLTNDTCQLDIQRRRRNKNPNDPNSTINTLLSLNYDEEDVKNEILSLTIEDYIETVKDKKKVDGKHYRIFRKKIKGREIYIKLKICDVNRIHLISFHYANWGMKDRPYE